MNESSGERMPSAGRLDRPPSDRYDRSAPPAGADGAGASGSLVRAALFAIPAGVIALAVYVGLAGPFSFTAGLVVVAIFAGRMIGLSAKAGGGTAVTSDRAVVVALLITLAWFVGAQIATWLFARSEGGVLSPVDYLGQVFGPVVPLVAIASVLAAWWSAR